MRAAVSGVLAGAGLALLGVFAVGDGPRAQAVSVPASASSELVTLSNTMADGSQQLTLIDPRSRSLCVYQITTGGELSLRSARKLHWHLQLTHPNNVAPTPTEVRTLLESR